GARRDILQALTDDGVREHGGGGGAITRDVGGLGSDLLHHLSAHVLVVVLELDLLGHRHAVLGDGGAAELLVDDHVAALGANGRLHGRRHDVDPAEQCRTPLVAENHLLWHLILLLISVDGMGRPVRSGQNASRTFVAYDPPDDPDSTQGCRARPPRGGSGTPRCPGSPRSRSTYRRGSDHRS